MSDGATIEVRVTTRSRRDIVEPPRPDGTLDIRVTAAPADGAANRSVVKLVAACFGVAKSNVSIVSGATSRHKRLRIEGLDDAALELRWPQQAVDDQVPR